MGRRKSGDLPAMRFHKPTGLARVSIAGRDHWLGRFGSSAAQAKYDELIAAFLASGRKSPSPPPAPPLPRSRVSADLTLGEVAVAWLESIKKSRPDWQKSSTWQGARAAIRAVRRWRRFPAKEFGPLAYQQARTELAATPIVRQRRIDGKLVEEQLPRSRRYVLDTMGRVRQMIAFAVSAEMVPGDRLHALEAVPAMPSSLGRISPHRQPVPVEDYERTLEHLTPATRAIVEFIRLTGCRPAEAASLRMADLEDRGQPVWKYRPGRHKNQWRGHGKVIPVGPRASAIVLEQARSKGLEDLVFDAREATPPRQSRESPRGARANPSGRVSGRFSSAAIRRAVARAAEKAKVPIWTPYQLRHLRLREVRRDAGREAAQAVAGHNRSTMVDHYAPPAWEAGERAAAATG